MLPQHPVKVPPVVPCLQSDASEKVELGRRKPRARSQGACGESIFVFPKVVDDIVANLWGNSKGHDDEGRENKLKTRPTTRTEVLAGPSRTQASMHHHKYLPSTVMSKYVEFFHQHNAVSRCELVKGLECHQ